VSVVAAAVLSSVGCRKHEAMEGEPLKVAAASDLAFAFKDVGALYERTTGRRAVFSFGSTGLLEKQLAEGAPFDVFAAADVAFADDAIAAGVCLADSKAVYASGRIVLFSAHQTKPPANSMNDLGEPRIGKIAIANPQHAPYGRAARQAMERAGIWDAISSKVVYGENVQQALEFAQSGNADVAIVALSLAMAAPGRWTLIAPELHDRIDQALAICTGGKAGVAAGRSFVALVRSAEGRAILRRYGFLAPGE
jgi:molybdate transport system substrate-binding protein